MGPPQFPANQLHEADSLKFLRQPLRDAIQKEILTRIVSGALPAGQRINETHLAEDLGISRTPLREAMLTLAAVGHLNSDMGKGFAVPALDPAELQQIVQILALIQPLTLGLIMPLDPALLVDLSNQLNRGKMKLGRNPQGKDAGLALAGLVYNWNEVLQRPSQSSVLTAEVNQLEGRAARYWFAAGNKGLETDDLLNSLGGLYELIRQGQKDRACQVWAEHIQKYGQMAVACLKA